MDRTKSDLENIKRDNIFKVPEHYFDELPMKIQSRITEDSHPSPVFISKVQLAWSLAAAIVLGFGLVFLLNQPATLDTEEMLAEVSTEEMIAYLETSEMTVFEMLEEVDVADLLDEGVDYWDYLEEDLSIEDIDQIYDEMDFYTDILTNENSI